MTISMLRSSSKTDSSSDLSQQVMFKQQPLALDCCCPDDKIGDPKDHHDSDHDDDEVSSTVTVEDTLAQEQKRKEALQQLVSNDFGLTLLAPLSCDGLMEFHRCDLHLHDSSSSATTSEARAIPPRQEEEGEGQHAAHEEKSTPKKARNHFIFGSLGSITAATQEPDSDEVTSHDDVETSTLEDSDDDDSDVEDDDDSGDDDDYVLSISQLLVPEPADDLQYCPRILSPKQMQQIYQRLPEGLRMNKWVRAFCIGRDGDSFLTLLNNCAPFTYTVIVIRTLHEEYVLGGFASQAWRCDRHAQNQNSYYGTGQSFLFATHPHDYNNNNNHTEPTTTTTAAATTKTPTSLSHASTPIMDNATRKRSSLSNILSNDDEDDDHEDDDDDDDVDLTFFGWTGSNDYCQICNSEKGVIAMGGEVDFGLRLENCFERGRTGYCKTFSNPPLVPDEGCHLGGHFEIADFEVYGLQPLFGGNLSSCSTTSSWSSLR